MKGKKFISNTLYQDILKLSIPIALPITLNGLSWGSAFATYSIIMSHLGNDVVAANGGISGLMYG